MDTGKKPQGHGKKVGEGSVNVNKTDKVETGSNKPVGAGGRPPAGGGGSGGSQRPQNAGV